MAEYYLGIDIGASSGRHILGRAAEGRLVLEEVYRFTNQAEMREGSLVWDTEKIFREIVEGLKRCAALGKIPRSIGIDTWGCDYALLDGEGRVISPVYAYRDSRTQAFLSRPPVPFREIFRITGIANQPFNSLYQLLADRAAGRLDRAAQFAMLPEYFAHRLAGRLRERDAAEYTNASTTMCVDVHTGDWAFPLIREMGLPERLFRPPRLPPYSLGDLSPEVQRETGFNAQVTVVAGHDTASAVSLIPGDDLYISSGTWSLLGTQGKPIVTDEAREAGYTNEGAWDGRTRFLKNIMGLWFLQELRRDFKEDYSFAQIEALARETEAALGAGAEDFLIDVNKSRFYNPPSMLEAVRDERRGLGGPVPESPGELAWCVYRSLAGSYKTAVEALEKLTHKVYPSLSIIGGGSKDSYLNALTARYTGKTVYAGPAEATATGNILLQMKQAGDLAVDAGFSELVRRSFDIREFRKGE